MAREFCEWDQLKFYEENEENISNQKNVDFWEEVGFGAKF